MGYVPFGKPLTGSGYVPHVTRNFPPAGNVLSLLEQKGTFNPLLDEPEPAVVVVRGYGILTATSATAFIGSPTACVDLSQFGELRRRYAVRPAEPENIEYR